MFGLGTEELVVILIIILVLFGAKKLPQLAKGVGESLKELRKGLSDDPHTKAEEHKNTEEQRGDAEKKA